MLRVMERGRCSGHGLILFDDGTCSRCRSEAVRRNASALYLALGAFSVAVLAGLGGWRALTTARADLPRRPLPAATAEASVPNVPSAAGASPTAVGTTVATREPVSARLEREARIAAAIHEVPVVLYTADYCGWCRKTKTWLDGHDVAYVERRVDVDPSAKRDLHLKFGEGNIPAIDIEGELHQGYSPDWIERTLRARAERRVGPG